MIGEFIMDEKLSHSQMGRPPQRNVIRVENAVIEEINTRRDTGYVTISHGVPDRFGTINMELVTLVVGQNTVIQDRRGRNLSLRDLRVGMTINAVYSSRMTFSQPPRAQAFRITVLEPSRDRDRETTVGTIVQVDVRNGFLYTVSSFNLVDLRRFVINNNTRILNRAGNRISLRDLRPGQRVRVEHARWQTFSIPPQTVAYVVRVL